MFYYDKFGLNNHNFCINPTLICLFLVILSQLENDPVLPPPKKKLSRVNFAQWEFERPTSIVHCEL